jgi:dTDP-4-amino-4,6-dideoxygalactose transaminase
LKTWTEKRIEAADHYTSLFKGTSVKTPFVKDNYKHVFHLYVIISENRDDLKKKLELSGIETAIHYPVALPFLDAYKENEYAEKDFPVAMDFTAKILSLPIYPELTKEMATQVVEEIKKNEWIKIF